MSYCLNAEEEATVDELNRFRGRDSGMYECEVLNENNA